MSRLLPTLIRLASGRQYHRRPSAASGGHGRCRVRRAWRVAGWNALLTVAGLGLLAGAGELWLRSTVPFMVSTVPRVFVPGVGLVGEPGAEVRATNRGLDFWQISRFNRQGFLDREPPNAEPAAAACHVTVFGDSFVEAMQVPIADKLHVRLEALAARRLGGLDVTTSAFGRRETGQINQLAWYDEFARKRRPKLIVLVFVTNDFFDNTRLLSVVRSFRDPDRQPVMTAERTADGTLRLRPPNPDYEDRDTLDGKPAGFTGYWHPPGIMRYVRAVTARAARWSYIGERLDTMAALLAPMKFMPRRLAWADVLRQEHPEFAPLLDSWPLTTAGRPLNEPFRAERLPPPYAAELEYTAFGLEQFRKRADRDGASLVILATHHLRPGEPLFDRMRAIADDLRIPVISLYDYIVRRGGRVRDAHWRHDRHWTPAGHQWAAEALLEYLRLHPDVCTRGPSSDAPPQTLPAARVSPPTLLGTLAMISSAEALELPRSRGQLTAFADVRVMGENR